MVARAEEPERVIMKLEEFLRMYETTRKRDEELLAFGDDERLEVEFSYRGLRR